MSLNLDYFREFTVLSDTLNYWEAADRLYLNQSTLSKHIIAPEKEIGYPLFTRSTRHVSLTAYGQALLPYARSISQAQVDYSAELCRVFDRDNGVLTIGCIPAMPQYRLTELILDFDREYSGSYRTKVAEGDTSDLTKDLISRTCELAFVRDLTSKQNETSSFDEQFVRIPYVTDRLVAVMSVRHRLAGETSLSLKDLKNEHFCFIKENSSLYDLSRRLCLDAGFMPDIVFDSHRIDSILEMVTNSDCVALLPGRHATFPYSTAPSDGVPFAAIPLEPEVCTSVSLCYMKDIPHSDASRAFVDFFRKRMGDEAKKAEIPNGTESPQ